MPPSGWRQENYKNSIWFQEGRKIFLGTKTIGLPSYLTGRGLRVGIGAGSGEFHGSVESGCDRAQSKAASSASKPSLIARRHEQDSPPSLCRSRRRLCFRSRRGSRTSRAPLVAPGNRTGRPSSDAVVVPAGSAGRPSASPHSRLWRRSAPAPARGAWCRRSGIGATCPIARGRRRRLGRAIPHGAGVPAPHGTPRGGEIFSLGHPATKAFSRSRRKLSILWGRERRRATGGRGCGEVGGA
jgi:hypothetical protein